VPARKTTLRTILAQNLRRLRVERGWSQEDLGAESGLHRTFIGAVERSETNVSVDNIERLAAALGVEGWTLLKR
jgi:transcriptional regulator with XRE-family HTH domain